MNNGDNSSIMLHTKVGNESSMRIEKEKTTSFFILTVLILLIINYVFSVSLNEFVYVVFFSVLFSLSRKENIIEMLCFFFPLSPLISSVTYIWLIVLAIMVVKSGLIIKKSRSLIILFFVVLELVAHYLYGISDTNRMGGYLLCMAVMIYLIYEDDPCIDYENCLILYSWGAFSLCAFYLENAMAHSPSGWMAMMAAGSLRIGGVVHSAFEGMTIDINANTLAYLALTGTVTSIVLFRNKAILNDLHRILFIFQMIFVTVIGALTVSRSWLLVIAICAILLYMSQKKTKNTMLKYLLIILLIILSGAVIFSQGNNFIVNAFVKRFTNGEMKTGAGRTEIFEQYMTLFWADDRFIWLGTGVTDYREVINMWQSMHMGLQQILICLGVPGAIVFLISVIKPVAFAIKERLSLLYWIPFVAIVLFTQTIQFLNPWLIMLPYVIGVYTLKYGYALQRNNDSE